jgi:hypothetical protein
MNLRPVDSATATTATQPAPRPGRARPPHAAAPAGVAALSTPATTTTISGVPASVKPEDRVLYMQILKAVGGNAAAALAALIAFESKQQAAAR